MTAGQRGWSGVEAEIAERRAALDALAPAREAERELTPDPRDLQQRMFSPVAPPELLTGDERATLGRLERAAAEGA